MNFHYSINLNDLYNGEDEKIEIIRAAYGFILVKNNPEYQEQVDTLVSYDANSYSNILAKAIVALAVDYSDRQANNFMSYFFGAHELWFCKNAIVSLMHSILYSIGFTKQQDTFTQLQMNAYKEYLDSATDAVLKDPSLIEIFTDVKIGKDVKKILKKGKDLRGFTSYIASKGEYNE